MAIHMYFRCVIIRCSIVLPHFEKITIYKCNVSAKIVFNAAVRFESGLDDTGTMWFTWVTFLMSQVGSFIHKLNYPDVIRILIDYVFIKMCHWLWVLMSGGIESWAESDTNQCEPAYFLKLFWH